MSTGRSAFLLLLIVGAALAGWYWPIDDGDAAPLPDMPAATADAARSNATALPPLDAVERIAAAPDAAADRRAADDAAAATFGSLVGLVLDRGDRPIEAATVTALPTGAPGTATSATTATTDATGRFCIPHLPPGNYRVRAAAANHTAAVAATVFVEEASEVQVETMRLAPGTSLRGLVVDSSGAPIGDATIQAGGERAASGADGRFEVPNLPLGPCAVEVRATGWLSWQQNGVDPARELRVVLPAGLVITGTVHAAPSAAPLEQFAIRAHRLQPLRALQQGTPDWQLRHRIERLQQGLANARDATARTNDERAIAEYAARLTALQSTASAPPRTPNDLGEPTLHADGRFTLDRLDEGLYVVEVMAPDHVFARTEPIVLQRGAAAPSIRIDLQPGLAVRGTVQATGGAPIAGARVELVRPLPATASNLSSSPMHWLVGERPPEGAIVAAATTDARGTFVLACQPAGICHLLASHPGHCTTTVPAFRIQPDLQMRIVMPERASLAGRVRGIPNGRAGEVHVLVLGGASNLREGRIDEQGAYRIQGLEPGEYVVRAGLGDPKRAAADLLHALFAGPAAAPRRDLVLAPGESRTLDLIMPLPPMGTVQGLVHHNGAPAPGCRIMLDIAGAARPLTADTDGAGVFMLRDVPAGDCLLRVIVRSSRSQELHREALTVAADTVTTVQPQLRSGGLAGRVVAADGTPVTELTGDLLLLPECAAMPADLTEYRRSHRVHQLTVRNGQFRGETLTVGRCLAIVRMRYREPTTTVVDVPAGAVLDLELRAGPAKP